jgi:SsrA-binding protein
MKIIANNKKARHDYFILESHEAGIKLLGSEIKSIRLGKVNINDSFVTFKDGEIYVNNLHISKYDFSNIFNHEETRPRKLLLHKNEILKLFSKTREQGLTIIPLKGLFKRRIMQTRNWSCKG